MSLVASGAMRPVTLGVYTWMQTRSSQGSGLSWNSGFLTCTTNSATMGHMTEMITIETPCGTGRLCTVPKRREAIYERFQKDPTYSANQASYDLNEVEDSCDHETHPDDWFEDPGAGYGTPAYWRAQRARARCFNQCPIRMQCLQIGMEPDRLQHGVYGGYTVAQREQLRPMWSAAQDRRAREVQAAKEKEKADAEKESPQGGAAAEPSAPQGDSVPGQP